jgi:PAS domain S-box-containing protein
LVDPKQSDAMKQKLQADGEVHNFEMQVRTKTGNIRTILLSLNPIVVNNEPCRLGISIDITEQKKEADALRESEEKYRTLVENSLQGLAIIQDSRIAFCNKAYAEIVGYSVEELLSISDANVLIHPDDHALVSMRYRDRLSGRAVPARYEHRLVAKGGEERWVEIYSSVVEFSGKPAVQCVFRDITERRKAAENLQKALDWQKAIFEGSRDAILVSDAEARFVDANEAVN